MCVTCSGREHGQTLQLCSFLPSQEREPPDPAGSNLNIQCRGDPGHTHTYTASSTPIAAMANANWESTREREILSAPGSGGGGWL